MTGNTRTATQQSTRLFSLGQLCSVKRRYPKAAPPGSQEPQGPNYCGSKSTPNTYKQTDQGEGQPAQVRFDVPPLDNPTTQEQEEQCRFIEHLLTIVIQKVQPEQGVVPEEAPDQQSTDPRRHQHAREIAHSVTLCDLLLPRIPLLATENRHPKTDPSSSIDFDWRTELSGDGLTRNAPSNCRSSCGSKHTLEERYQRQLRMIVTCSTRNYVANRASLRNYSLVALFSTTVIYSCIPFTQLYRAFSI